MIRDLTPPEQRKSRYHWLVEGELDNKTVLVMEDHHHYWRVVLLATGETVMTAFDRSWAAARWAESRGYKVLQPC